jgi:hypothetical protein
MEMVMAYRASIDKISNFIKDIEEKEVSANIIPLFPE